MFKRLSVGLLVIGTSITQSLAASSCQSINISAHPNYPPFHWKSGDTLTGASIEISKQIFESLGLQTNIQYQGPWKRVLHSAQSGNIDFIPALKKSYERSQYLVFSATEFALNPVAVFTKKWAFNNISKLSELNGRFGSINSGDKHGQPIDFFIHTQKNVQQVQGLEQNFQMLALARTDYFITGYYVGNNYIVSNNLEDKFEVVLKFDGTVVHNAFSKRFANECGNVIKGFEQKLNQLKNDGKVEQAIAEFNEIWLSSSK